MTVRKKIVDSTRSSGSISLARELKTVRETIAHLPNEEIDMNETPAEASPSTSTSTPSNPKPARKATVKKTAKKKSSVVKKAAANGTLLATICKSVKMDPRRARRILRTAKVKNPGRWTFTTASEVARVKKLLQNADAE